MSNFFDKKDIVEEEASFFDKEDVIEDSKEEVEATEPMEMGVGEAALTGFGEGASLGMAPMISGAVGAAGEVVEDIGDMLGLTTDSELRDQGFEIQDQEEGLSGLAKAYYESRDAQKAQQEKAFEDQTTATLAGNFLGGSAILPGAGALAQGLSKGGKAAQIAGKALPKISTGMKGAAIEGAKAGALAGFGSGEARLVDEDKGILEGAEDILTETAATGVIGGLAAGGLTKGLQGLGKLVKRIPGSESFRTSRALGKEGVSLDEKEIEGAIKSLSENMRKKVGEAFKKNGMEKADALEFADEIGLRVNAGEAIDDVIDDIIVKKATSIEDMAEKSKFVKSMAGLKREITPETEALAKLETKRARQAIRLQEKGFEPVQAKASDVDIPEGQLKVATDTYVGPKNKEVTKIADQLLKDPSGVELRDFDLEKLTLGETEQIIAEINRHTGDLTSAAKSETEKRARQLAGRLRELSNEAMESSGDLAGTNQKLSKLFNALQVGGVKGNVNSKSQMQTDEQVDALRKLLGSEGRNSDMKRERVFKYLNQADDGAFKADEKRSEVLRKGLGLAKFESSESGGLMSFGRRILGEAGSMEGRMERAVTQSIANKKAFTEKMLYKMAGPQLDELSQQLTSKYGEKAKAFVGPLQKAAQGESKSAQAIMFGLYQQPAFRQMLKEMGEFAIDENEE